MSATVQDVMTTHVVTIREDTPYKEIAARFREYRVSAFPVVDDQDKVVGIVSEADLLSKEALKDGTPGAFRGIRRHREQVKAAGVVAADLMTKSAIAVGPGEPVTHAARVMYARGLRRLPVVAEDGHLAGIVTRSDVLSVFSKPDEEIRRDVWDNVVLKSFLIDPARLTITVKDGIVTIEGSLETTEVGHELIKAVSQAEGVVAVRDRIGYPPIPRRTSSPLVWG